MQEGGKGGGAEGVGCVAAGGSELGGFQAEMA